MMDEISWKEFMDLRFKSIEEKIDQLRMVLDGMTAKFETMDDRLNEIEGTQKAYRYIGGLVAAVILALVIGWLKQALGI